MSSLQLTRACSLNLITFLLHLLLLSLSLSDSSLIDVPGTYWACYFHRAFASACPHAWHILPPDVTTLRSFTDFRSLLKGHLPDGLSLATSLLKRKTHKDKPHLFSHRPALPSWPAPEPQPNTPWTCCPCLLQDLLAAASQCCDTEQMLLQGC